VVVDDDREVVGPVAVGASQHEVVDDRGDRPAQLVVDGDPRGAGPHAQRGRASGALALGALRGVEVPAGPRVGALGAGAVRRARGLADLRARAPARVHERAGVELGDRGRVVLRPRGLPHDLAVPVEPERREVAELLGHPVLAGAPAVDVLHAHHEPRAVRAGPQPREQRGAQVAQVQRAGGGGRVAAGGHAPTVAAQERTATVRP
jgi:hypothetical protein